MDWKLTKSLYIIVFLLMNIALIYIYLNERQESVEEIQESPDVLSMTNIDMSNIEEYEPVEMNVLTGAIHDFSEDDDPNSDVDDDNVSGTKITEEFEEDGPEMTEQGLQDHMDENVYRGSEYQYDNVMSTSDQVISNQLYENFPIFNHESARIIFHGEGRQADTMEQTRLRGLEENEYTLSLTAKSPREIVEELYERERISSSAVIDEARLGYYIILTEENNALLRPKWEMHVTDQDISKTIYVDATTDSGEIIESE